MLSASDLGYVGSPNVATTPARELASRAKSFISTNCMSDDYFLPREMRNLQVKSLPIRSCPFFYHSQDINKVSSADSLHLRNERKKISRVIFKVAAARLLVTSPHLAQQFASNANDPFLNSVGRLDQEHQEYENYKSRAVSSKHSVLNQNIMGSSSSTSLRQHHSQNESKFSTGHEEGEAFHPRDIDLRNPKRRSQNQSENENEIEITINEQNRENLRGGLKVEQLSPSSRCPESPYSSHMQAHSQDGIKLTKVAVEREVHKRKYNFLRKLKSRAISVFLRKCHV